MPDFKSLPQYPTNWGGPPGQHAVFARGTIRITGSGGLVGTAYGFAGFSATHIATGTYDLRFPSSSDTSIHPVVEAPTGVTYQHSITAANSATGAARLIIVQPGFAGSGFQIPSGSQYRTNPISGTQIRLLFAASPSTAF